MRRLMALCIFALIAIPLQAQYDTYGGWLNLKGKKTGFYHTEKIDGRWWLVTPEGTVFLSKGVCEVDSLRGLECSGPPSAGMGEMGRSDCGTTQGLALQYDLA